MLSIKALNQLRALARRTFPDLATIYEPPAADGGDFGEAASAVYPTDWTVLVTEEPCRLMPTQRGLREALNTQQVQQVGEFTALFRTDLPRPSASAKVRITQGDLVMDFEIAGIVDSSDRVMTKLYLNRANPAIIAS